MGPGVAWQMASVTNVYTNVYTFPYNIDYIHDLFLFHIGILTENIKNYDTYL